MTKNDNISLAAIDQQRVIHGFSNLRDRRLMAPIVFERGEGCYIYDDKGNKYLDAISGIWCTSLGLSNDTLIEAATYQLRKMAYFPSLGAQSNKPLIEFSDALSRLAPMDDARVYMGVTGSDAVDSVLKFIRLKNNGRQERQKKHIIARHGDFHGSTLATASITGAHLFHDGFDIPNVPVTFVSQPNYYANANTNESVDAFVDRLGNELELVIKNLGADNVAAFFVEPIGTAAGVIVPPKDYFPRISGICRKYDIDLCADEIVTGMGRTGRIFACEHFDLSPDAIVLGKGLTSAYVPGSAVIVSGRFYEQLETAVSEAGFLAHGQTYSGHPVSAAVGLATLRFIQRENILDRVVEAERTAMRKLEKIIDHPLVGDVRGLGLLYGIEIVPANFILSGQSANTKLAARVQHECRRLGLLVRVVSSGFVITITPALTISLADLELTFDLFKEALDIVYESLHQ